MIATLAVVVIGGVIAVAVLVGVVWAALSASYDLLDG